MELILQHETALEEFGIPLNEYPKSIGQSVKSLKALMAKYGVSKEGDNSQVSSENMIAINTLSARIAHDMQDHYERDFEDENQNQNNMLTGDELTRAQAVGLDENATIAQVVEKETDIAAAADLAAQDLKARAIAVQLPETATEEEITAAEQKAGQVAADAENARKELIARASAVGLPETATLSEIEAAENPPPPPAAPKPKSVADELEDAFDF